MGSMADPFDVSSLGTAIESRDSNSKKSRKPGNVPVNRPARKQLLIEFDFNREAQNQGHSTRQYFLCDPYPPSTKSIDELSPISITDLQSETHHSGKVLFIRTIDDAVRDAAVQTIVEDEAGTADRLAVYNTDVVVKAEELLPEDAIFAIREPYFMLDAKGAYSIRIDHPSDLVSLSSLDPQVPEAFRSKAPLDKSALKWKDEGNAAYNSGRHVVALRAYSHGLESCPDNDIEIRPVILRNRAMVNISMMRFEPALADAKAATIPANDQGSDQASALNVKSLQRAGHAAYKLGRFRGAEAFFKEAQTCLSDDQDAARNLERIAQRLREQSAGDYDFMAMSKSASKKYNRLEHADFTANTAIREAGAHGKGLFAAKDIAAGQLVLCEKAFCVAFDSDGVPQTYSILDQKTRRNTTGTQATLLFNCVQKLLYNPELANRFFELYDAGYTSRVSLEPKDSLVPVDTFRTLAILNFNAYGCPTVRSSSNAAQKQLASPEGYPSTGMWVRTAYCNHACDGNAMRSFIGDMMIIRATRDIKEGEEILMPYRLPSTDNTVTQGELQKVWGFKCDCGICTVEAATTATTRKSRLRLIEKASSLTSTRPQSLQPDKLKSTISQVEKLFVRIKNTYDEKRFENRPRLGLVAPGLWLCQAHRHRGSQYEVIKAATGLLRDLGFIVTVSEKTVSIDRSFCCTQVTAIDAAMYAAKAYHDQGASAISKQMKEFAEDLYRIMSGELRGFEDKYNEL